MSWRYDQRTGSLYHEDQFITTGYSGFPPHVNDPDSQIVKNLGPIPRGMYHIGKPYDSPNVGPFALPLEALPGTATFGRGDFRIHGDSRIAPGAASHGCIILPRQFRQQIAAMGDDRLEVFCSQVPDLDGSISVG